MRSDIPHRLDRLPWSRWHLFVIGVLAITWLLDGLEGSLGGSLAGALKSHAGLSLTDAQLGLSSTFYLAGAVCGALLFGYLADRYGRRRLFSWTLILYLCATAATGLSWNLWSFTLFRVLTGAGIGGEYAAINSAVDELTPARLRGRIDLWINATFWLGIILGSVVSSALLATPLLSANFNWRLAFCSGLPIAAAVVYLRRYIPESPRWLLTRGRSSEAEAAMQLIEIKVVGAAAPPPHSARTAAPPIAPQPYLRRLTTLLNSTYRRRAALCFGLMAAQAFFYNSVFFSLALVLLRYYGVAATVVGIYFIPIAVANFLGPVALGWFFDTVGRRSMMLVSFAGSGLLLFASSVQFLRGSLSLHAQIAWWSATFFFASCAASSAYLAASELFPQTVRATSISIFYALGTLAGGVFGPLVFGRLIGSASRSALFYGYSAGAVAMIAAGIAQAIWGVASERKPLEELAPEYPVDAAV